MKGWFFRMSWKIKDFGERRHCRFIRMLGSRLMDVAFGFTVEALY
jgi:hypothetical protein